MLTVKYLFICACVYSSVLSALFDAFKLLTAYLASKKNNYIMRSASWLSNG